MLSILMVLFVVLITYITYKGTEKPPNFPPGPPRLPIIGSLPYVLINSKKSEPRSLLSGIRKVVETYGTIVGFYIGNEPSVVLADFEVIKNVFKRNEASGRPSMIPFRDIRSGYWLLDEENSGNMPGIAFSQGKFCSQQKRFTSRALKELGLLRKPMESIIQMEVEKFCTELARFEGKPFKIHGRINISILNTLWHTLVGETLDLDNPRLLTIVNLLDKYSTNKDVSGALASMFPFPEMIRWPPFYRALGLNLPGIKNHWNQMKLFVEEYVINHQSSFDKNNIRDFLDLYLDEIQKHQLEPNSSFYRERGYYMLINVLIDLFFAGMETTSSTITWTILLLLHHPNIKEKVIKEIDQVVGRKQTPQLGDREHMHYTNAVLEESFRIVSFVYIALPHSAMKDIKVGEYFIPKGTTIFSSLYHVMNDPHHFAEPDKFKPERFIDENGKFNHDERVIPFGIGKRSCLGQSLAEKEYFLFMVGLLQRFDISPSPLHPLPDFHIDANTPQNILRRCPDYHMIITSRK